MVDPVTLLVAILLAVTGGAAFQYYREVRKAQKEYEKARTAVEDIVLSFNRELKREADRLELMAYKVEANSSKAETSLKKSDATEKKVTLLEDQLSNVPKNLQATVADCMTKVQNIESLQSQLKGKVETIDQQLQKFSTLPESGTEPVIPIRRDKAIAALTDTELAVLEFLSSEGSRTAPEIKEKVKLSREHTARLMKKLYEEGYLERETDKIPFKYSVKKEMEKLLKKPESTQA